MIRRAAGSNKLIHSLTKTLMEQLNRDQKFTVAIEGNIGCGKTTLLKYFSKFPDTLILEEPVKKWTNLKGHNLLSLFYQDPSRYGLTFQTYIQFTMLQSHTLPFQEKVKLMERSIYSGKYCFTENLFRSGKMPEAEYLVLGEWFDWIIKSGNAKLDLIVYLRTDPEVVYKRIMDRKRPEETSIPYEYIKTLHEMHEDWLIHEKLFKLPAPILVLDANPGLDIMSKAYEENSKQILCCRN